MSTATTRNTDRVPRKQSSGDPEVAAALTRCRTARGISQYRLARLVNVTSSYISRIEDGTRLPSRAMAQQLADVVGPEVMIAAGFIPDGYRVVKDEPRGNADGT